MTPPITPRAKPGFGESGSANSLNPVMPDKYPLASLPEASSDPPDRGRRPVPPGPPPWRDTPAASDQIGHSANTPAPVFEVPLVEVPRLKARPVLG
ncbi:hypothetical protein NHX12_012923 [Muraenolepis orangiensis]|uniref:Uncharacterized protein n=1 Tax=Muraenolepis orangiensis TaxID=630683 RepID=A0A9Q0I7K0_9TELE|nr:hypothetical protein NHX12_012923 [Muraenolepis orangiensis]